LLVDFIARSLARSLAHSSQSVLDHALPVVVDARASLVAFIVKTSSMIRSNYALNIIAKVIIIIIAIK